MPSVRGVCHICTRELGVTYCSACGHFFCDDCKKAWWPRGWAAIKELLVGSMEGCCGPSEG